MSHTFQTTEGLILRVIPFKDYDQILVLFTEKGLIKVIEKGGRSKSRGKKGLCTPLTQVELIYSERRGEIFCCHEIHCLDSFTILRQELLFLEVASDFLQALLTSQLPGKEAPQLYALLLFYLKKIPLTASPWILATSFRLKLLKHDGLSVFPFICFECGSTLEQEAFVREADCGCILHQPQASRVWVVADLQKMYQLATCQNYRELNGCDISQQLQNQVRLYFEACLKS